MARNTVRIAYTGDDSSLKRASRSAEGHLDRVNNSGKRAFGGLGKAALAGGAALIGTGGIVFGLKKAAEAAIEAEKTQARLVAQLNSVGKDSQQTRKHIDDVVTAQSRMSGFDDEDLTDAFTNILRVTGDVTESLELNSLAMDFARGKQIEVAKAGELVGKVAGGNVGILSRYGITIEKGASASEALALLQERFAGQAEKYGQTTAGALDRSKVAAENLGESLGERLAPWIATASNFLADSIPKIEAWGTALANRASPHVEAFADTVREHLPTVRTILEVVGNFVRDHLVPIFRGLASIVAETWQRVLAVLKQNEPEIRRIFDNLGKAVTNLWAVAEPILRLLFTEVLPRAINIAIKALDKVAAAFSLLARIIRGTVSAILTATDKFLGGLQGLAEAASHIPGIGGKFRGVADDIGKARDRVRELRDQINQTKGKTIKVRVELGFTDPGGRVQDGVVSFDQALQAGAKQFSSAHAVFPSAANPGGLSPWVLDELGIGQGMGLTLTSGYRAGSTTTSGRKSLHSVGQAIDMSGAPATMAMFAQAVAGRSGIAEVLYTPVGGWYPGVGWTRLTGKIADDHYSHVHVGVRGGDGRVGVGDGRRGIKPRPGVVRRAKRLLRPPGLRFRGRLLPEVEFPDTGPVPETPPFEPTGPPERQVPTDDLPDDIEESIFDAEDTPGAEDDISARERALGFLRGELARATTPTERLPIKKAIRALEREIAELRKGPDITPDLQAQLAQAKERAAVAQRGFQLGEAFIRSGGLVASPFGSGPTVVFQSLVPDAEQIRRATEAIARGAGDQGYRPATAVAMGI